MVRIKLGAVLCIYRFWISIFLVHFCLQIKPTTYTQVFSNICVALEKKERERESPVVLGQPNPITPNQSCHIQKFFSVLSYADDGDGEFLKSV